MDAKQSEELRKERTKLIRDTVAFNKTNRVPHVSMFQLWQVLDYGCKLSEAMRDYDLMEKVVRTHQERYNFDLLVNTGVRNPFNVYEAIGCKSYQIDDEKESINHQDIFYCEHDELEELAADYWKFIWEKGMPKKYPFWGGDFDLDILQKAIDERNRYFAFAGHMSTVLREEYGHPTYCRPLMPPAIAVENAFSYVRGIKGLGIDMRRDPEKLEAFIETYNQMNYYPQLEALKSVPDGQDPEVCMDMATTFLCQNIMNTKQWDKYYWPYLKPILDLMEEKGWSYSIFPEGTILRFKDYFADYKKGTLAFMLEMDDCFEFRKELPNCAIMGGMDSVILGSGTKEDCVDLVKRLCDEIARDGGFILTQSKIGTFRADGKRENLEAVCDFIQNYRM